MGFPIRKSADQSSFAAPRGLSQRSTSFIASQRQGIHQMPLRHLNALIIDAHRRVFGNQVSVIRILLMHDSCRPIPEGNRLERPACFIRSNRRLSGQASPAFQASDLRSQASGTVLIPEFLSTDPRMEIARRSRLKSHAALGSISSSRCQTTRAPGDEAKNAQIEFFTNELLRRDARHAIGAQFFAARCPQFEVPNSKL